MKRFTFQLGSHDLNTKRGHTKACGAAQAIMHVYATSLDNAIEKANLVLFEQFGGGRALVSQSHYSGASFEFSIQAKVTKRNLIAEVK